MTRPTWVQLLRWLGVVTVATVFAVFLGGSMVWIFERDSPASNLKHWGDCLWWAVTTLSTVGYGEHFPVTLPGRLVAVAIMASGVAIIGAVAAVVAFAFASRLTARLEAAVHHMESQVEHVEHEVETFTEQMGDGPRSLRGVTGLRELVIGVADGETAGSLTWLLARLGWHPEAGDTGVAWRDGGVVLRVAVRPWDQPFGVQGRLTFSAGSPERLARIAREAGRHGFHRVLPRVVAERAPDAAAGAGVTVPAPLADARLDTDLDAARFTVEHPASRRSPIPGTTAGTTAGPAPGAAAVGTATPPPIRPNRRSPHRVNGRAPEAALYDAVAEAVADGEPVTLRAVSGFEVVLVTS